MYMINGICFNSAEQTISFNEKSILLNPKANQLLLFMAQNPNKTLSREEILTSVWSRDFVSDHSLTQAVSDLRKALAELSAEHKRVIITRPKAGYVLEADVKLCDLTSSLSNDLPTAKTHILKQSKIMLGLLVITLISAISIAVWSLPKGLSTPNVTIDPYNMVFVTFESEPKYQHFAFSLSDLINYRVNQQGRYRSSLLYEQSSELSERAALVMSGFIEEQDNLPVLTFYIYDNLSNNKVFEKQYSLHDDVISTVPKIILSDIESALEAPFDHEIISKLDRQYPQDAATFNLIHKAHYASNIITVRSLYSAIKLYDQVLAIDPTLEIAAAERFISASILNSIQPNAISTTEMEVLFNSLMDIDDELHAPIYYEALAIHSFSLDDPKQAKEHLSQALSVRESWTSNILAGKISQAEGKDYQAATSYKRAYSMKPDESTLRVVNTLLFTTNLTEFGVP
ncbi:C terminal [Vibrio sp. B1REV9]|nr:C terminal [Vibrio sp. B1REV9]